MSNFACETCGTTQADSPTGYVAGCCHYPPAIGRKVVLRFDDTGDRDAVGFYDGSFYLSRESQRQRKAVHPVEWFVGGVK